MPQILPTTRRRFSYSLRSLFVLITLAAVGMAWIADERRQSQYEMEIAEQLQARNETVTSHSGRRIETVFVYTAGRFDPHIPDIYAFFNVEIEASWWRQGLSRLCGRRIRVVDLKQFPTADLSLFAQLKNIEQLHVYDTVLTDITPLAGLPSLERLALEGTQVIDLRPIAGLKNLEVLDLGNTAVSDISPVAELAKLEYLELDETGVSDLAPLHGLKNLRELHIEGTEVGDEQIEMLEKALPTCLIQSGRTSKAASPVEP